MGAESSKPQQNESGVQKRQNSKRLNKRKRASFIWSDVQELKRKIEEFDGLRDDPQYRHFQSILSKQSQEVQDLKTKSKQDTQELCDNVLTDIVNMLKLLEEVVTRNENDLDSCAIESHSFINQTPHMMKKDVSPIKENASVEKINNLKHFGDLDQLEENTKKLMQEINTAIQLEDAKSFVVLERKIKLLYADLEVVEVPENSIQQEKKENISRQLIRFATFS